MNGKCLGHETNDGLYEQWSHLRVHASDNFCYKYRDQKLHFACLPYGDRLNY